ncbi:MAG: hypothetical protein IPL96_17310 [Holophagaceae bacterium]|nr:hypothetical protein [Holophagaceae bacterium]
MVAAISDATQRANNIQRFNASTLDEGGGLFHIACRVRNREHLVDLIGQVRRVKGGSPWRGCGGAFLGSSAESSCPRVLGETAPPLKPRPSPWAHRAECGGAPGPEPTS